jgi:disulfide bond formation protein DsbB
MLPGKRQTNSAGVIACGAMMAYALYSQYVLALEPCPLCVLQRIAVILLGFLFLIAALHNGAGKAYAGLLGLVAAAGAAVAAWHVRLQHMPPDEVPSCGPGLDYILNTIPLQDMFAVIFKGSGQCAEISWRFLGLSMPAWVIIGLLGLGLVGVWNNLRKQ